MAPHPDRAALLMNETLQGKMSEQVARCEGISAAIEVGPGKYAATVKLHMLDDQGGI